jgi:hypothetical protein
MKPVHLVFETPGAVQASWFFGRRHSALARGAGVLLIATLIHLLALAVQWTATRQELAATNAELRAQRRTLPAVNDGLSSLSAPQRRAWNEVTTQLNTPWGGLLDALERATPDDVALVSIEPDAARQTVRLQAEAKTLDTLLAYAQQLAGTPTFMEAVPLKHETHEQDPNRPIRLTMNLRLRGSPMPRVEGTNP